MCKTYQQRSRSRALKAGTHSERTQAPVAAFANQAQNRTEVVREDCRTEPTAIDQTGRLEKLFLLCEEFRRAVRVISRYGIGVDVSSALVDLKELLCDVLCDEGTPSLSMRVRCGELWRRTL
jgi:hypothetical protein